jgi:hypothetical protein
MEWSLMIKVAWKYVECDHAMTPMKTHTDTSMQGYSKHRTASTNSISSLSSRCTWVSLTFSRISSFVVNVACRVKPNRFFSCGS